MLDAGPGAMSVHPSVLRGFGAAAESYERARPDYPSEAVNWLAERLGLEPGRTVVDLAAGTGKLTRLLVPTGARVVAVEPVDPMRAQLERAVPGVEALSGYAERMPFDDGFTDAVTSAQAFHWFATDEALDEIARVLRPGGRLGLVWNTHDEDELWPKLGKLFEPLRGDEQTHVGAAWRSVLEHHPRFGLIEEGSFSHHQVLDPDELVERVASVSFVASAPEEKRRELLARLPEVAGDGPVRITYVTRTYASERV
jgi:SAM-dependent methyltransferase